MTTEINWNAPLEAFHNDGRVFPAIYDHSLAPRGHKIIFDENDGEGEWSWFFDNHGHMFVDKKWTIRNAVPATTNNLDAKAVAPEIAERMRKLIETLASGKVVENIGLGFCVGEARIILSALKPVDPDVGEAEKIAGGMGFWPVGMFADHAKEIALAAIKRGRQLQSEVPA